MVKLNNNYFLLRLATCKKASLFCLDGQTGRSLDTVGHVRTDFGSSGKGFHHIWWLHNEEQLNTSEPEEALQQFVDAMWTDGPLRDLPSIDRLCCQSGGTITEDGLSYGYLAEMGSYRFCLRCITSPGGHQCYLYCYDLRQQTLGRLVSRVSFANGEYTEFTAPQDYLRTIWEEPLARDGTSLLFETLTDAPTVHKAVDDMVYDLYGKENPRPLEDHVFRRGPGVGGQQM